MSSVPTFSKKAINLICSIGNVNISRKAIKTMEIERNYSDVSNKFVITLIDTPQTSITDLELYMCAGNRTISISYNDNPDSSGFVSFKGQIWDYTSTFVGNIKQLTISGYVTRTTIRDNSGVALYNIDWNNYFCMRTNVARVWNINSMLYKDQDIRRTWEIWNQAEHSDDRSQYTIKDSRVTVYKDFAAFYKTNAVTVNIKGPGGSINLPVPDTFAKMVLDQRTDSEKGKKKYSGDENDPRDMLWGRLNCIYVDPQTGYEVDNPDEDEKENLDIYWRQPEGAIRAFRLVGNPAYIQLNPAKEYYGAGSFLNSDLGVDPSYIVKQLCELEGWDYDDSTIVQTEMVPNSDSFKMKNQSALQFITEVLAPVSITPAGYYQTKSGEKIKVTSGMAGFTAWFDENSKFHFEPLTSLYKQDKTNILLGYNLPNSPVISFQVDTKGTAFYTTNVQEINSIYITTGKEVKSIDTTEQQLQDEYNKVKGHNEVLDEFFGYTYEEIQDLYEKKDNSATEGLYLGFGNARIDTNTANTENLATSWFGGKVKGVSYGDLSQDNGQTTIYSSKVQSKLVTSLVSSGAADSTSVNANLKTAANKIEEFMITATLNMWGDTRIAPASLIYVTNMVKSTDNRDVTRHPTSGTYLIIKQTDKVANDSFTQQLSLVRAKASIYSNINPQNIDFSKGVERLNEKTNAQIKMEQKAKKEVEDNVNMINENKDLISKYTNLWDEYIKAIEKRKPGWVYWENGKYPTIADDFPYMAFMMYWNSTPNSSGSRNNIYKKGLQGADTAWYQEQKSTRQTDFKSLAVGPIKIDSALMSWYTRAQAYKTLGKLGTVMLHHPNHLTPKGEKLLMMTGHFDLYDDWDPRGYRYSERGESYWVAK